jgi:hypothetical protein
MDKDLYNFLNGFNTGHGEPISFKQQLKDRMKTKILQAKGLSKEAFIKTLAEDYILISRTL